MPIDLNASLAASDPDIAAQIENEITRQHDGLEMIASENFVSRAVLEAAGTVFTNKYAEGYPGKRYYGGCEFADVVENIARDRAKLLFGAEHVNVQPHSGSQANAATCMALLTPGDTILGLDLAHGGHLTHGHKLNFSGKLYRVVGYQVRKDTETVDYDELEALALREKPKMIIGGGSAYPRQFDFERMRDIADKAGAYLMIDMAHFAGLVAGGAHPSPVPHAHVVTTTTHKTLRGPRAGMVLCRLDLAAGIDRSVFPGQQGGPLMHIIAAKAVAFKEALAPEFATYAQQVIAKCKGSRRRPCCRRLSHHLRWNGHAPDTRGRLPKRNTRLRGRTRTRRGRNYRQQERNPLRHQSADEAKRNQDRNASPHNARHERGRDADYRRVDRASA